MPCLRVQASRDKTHTLEKTKEGYCNHLKPKKEDYLEKFLIIYENTHYITEKTIFNDKGKMLLRT